MVSVSSLDDQIDQLYQQPLAEFVTARTALAKTLDKEGAKQVKALPKPTVVPWAVNQLYWAARPVYDALMKSGAALRRVQLSSLKGQRADVRQATEAHRDGVRAAVKEAVRLAAQDGANPDRDLLARMLEALSLAAAPPPESPGRFVTPLQPSGFEALAGVAIKAPVREAAAAPAPARTAKESPAQRAAEQRRAREEAAKLERQRADTIRLAEHRLEQARAREDQARQMLERAQAEVAAAEQHLKDVR